MGNRLDRAVTTCILWGPLLLLSGLFGLTGLFGPAMGEVAVGRVGSCQAEAGKPLPRSASQPVKAAVADSAAMKSSSDDDDDNDEDEEEAEVFLDPMGPNAACYVCHMTFIHEELSKVHLQEKVTCIECHGISGPHANDEDIGATKPDKIYPRNRINASCRKCHEEHDAQPEKVIARWIEIGLPQQEPVCTDCHGTHKIERPEPEEPARDDDPTNATDDKTEK